MTHTHTHTLNNPRRGQATAALPIDSKWLGYTNALQHSPSLNYANTIYIHLHNRLGAQKKENEFSFSPAPDDKLGTHKKLAISTARARPDTGKHVDMDVAHGLARTAVYARQGNDRQALHFFHTHSRKMNAYHSRFITQRML